MEPVVIYLKDDVMMTFTLMRGQPQMYFSAACVAKYIQSITRSTVLSEKSRLQT